MFAYANYLVGRPAYISRTREQISTMTPIYCEISLMVVPGS